MPSGEHTMQYTNNILQNHIPVTYKMLLTIVTPINLIFLKMPSMNWNMFFKSYKYIKWNLVKCVFYN